MEFLALAGDRVRRLETGAARVVVVELPRRERAGLVHLTPYVDDAGRPEIRPREFLFARPDQLDGLLRRTGDPRRLDCRVSGVLAAVGGARVRDDHADFVSGDLESLDQ